MIELPDVWAWQVEPQPSLVGFAVDQTSPLTGASQRAARPGLFELAVSLPPMDYNCAQGWIADLAMALTEPARIAFPQTGFVPAAAGATVVDGAGQTGTTLLIKSGTPGALVRKGQFLTVTAGARRYLYTCRAATTLDGSGAAALPIYPILRRSPANNAVVSLDGPTIEGLVQGDRRDWTIDLVGAVGLQFTIREQG